jgi:hypothetical protein
VIDRLMAKDLLAKPFGQLYLSLSVNDYMYVYLFAQTKYQHFGNVIQR